MKKTRWQNCNVLEVASTGSRLWHFNRSGSKTELAGERRFDPGTALPAQQVGKGTAQLWQPRLNVAWLPAREVFLRLIELPPCDPAEIAEMIELRLEEFSPLPLSQVVWTLEPLPTRPGEVQRVILALATRNSVEAFLGELEQSGYLADRLDLPQVRELLSTPPESDGLWVYVRREGLARVCLATWWTQGALRNLNLLALAGDESDGAHLVELLKQLCWAGEIEGWHQPEQPWHLVADPESAEALVPALRELAEDHLQVREPRPAAELAAVSAGQPTDANLLPPELAALYRRRWIDRLWMRALGAVAALYVAVVVIYFGAVQIVSFQKSNVEDHIAALKHDYHDALKLEAQVVVLRQQVNLKFAALDCLKAASDALPAEMTLNEFSFYDGKKLQLYGTVPATQGTQVASYVKKLNQSTAHGEILFSNVVANSISVAPAGQGEKTARWRIECDLQGGPQGNLDGGDEQ